MGITNLDSLTLNDALVVGGNASAVNGTFSGTLSFEGGEFKVTTVTATADNTLDVSGIAVGDVVLAINATSDGSIGTPGTISTGAVACTQVADSNEYVVAWIDVS